MNPRVILVGVGLHGSRMAHTLLDQGGELVGAADPAPAGQTLREFLGRDGPFGDAVISADGGELAAEVKPDVAIVVVPVQLDGLKELVFPLFEQGVNVLTIQPDAFDPPEEWAAEIDERARANGVSFLSTGVQDVWWVHMPAVAAGSITALTRVDVDHVTDGDTLSVGVARMLGFGQPESAFAKIREEMLGQEQPVLGGPLRVLARRLGLTPGPAKRTLEPIIAEAPIEWKTAGETVAAGDMRGFSEAVDIETEEGVHFYGAITAEILPDGDLPYDRVQLTGDPVIRLEHKPFPGQRVTDLVPVARVRDIVDAPAGFHTAATMPPASYKHTS